MKGHIYCFNTHENPNIIKAGHTQQEVQKRLRGYLGPTKPRHIIFTLKVDDSVEAEKMMLQLMRQCISLTHRDDLGNEWFETSGNFNFEQRATHLQNIARIVQKASENKCIVENNVISDCYEEVTIDAPAPSQATSLSGLEEYFSNFDRYVAQYAPSNCNALTLLKNFESSSFCPYFCQFLPYSEEQRAKVAGSRYSDFIMAI